MDPKLMAQFQQFQAFMAMQELAAQAAANPTPASKPTTPEAKVAAHLQAKQATDQDGETVSKAAAQVAAQQKLSGPTLKVTPKTHVPEGMIKGQDGGPAVALSDFPTHALIVFPDGTEQRVNFGQPKVSPLTDKGGGKPGVYGAGKAERSSAKFQIGINVTRIYKPGKDD